MPSELQLRLSLGQHSAPGRHGGNQDFHGALLPGPALRHAKGVVVALADGIGSSPVSQVASAMAVKGFIDDYYATSETWSTRRSAQRVLGATNAWLHAQTQRSDARFDKDRGYVCTFSALIFKGREAHLLHVGDSRIYRLHRQALEPLTEDHRVHGHAAESYLGRALGVGAQVDIDYARHPLEVGEVYLLATDGAYSHLGAEDVHRALQQFPQDLDAAAAALVQAAQSRGSTDDATLQIVRIDALPEEDAPGLALQQQALAPALAPRAVFEGCTIVRELHASPRSHVYLATDRRSGQALTLKIPSVEVHAQPDHLDRLLREEWIARRLDSPHTLRAWSLPSPRQHLCVALEYVEGQTLAQWMADHPAPDLDSVRGIVAQIAKGLHAFHRKEMLHQDLRPHNVMLDRTGTVKLIDYGSAHVAGLAEHRADGRAQALVGSLQYTAPEYFVGGAGSPASDLFALAVITYQMLTQQLPYGLAVTQLRSPGDLRRLRYTPVRHLRPDLPPWLDAVLHKALHPQPGKRQESVTELVQDLYNPRAEFHRRQNLPLIERDPVLLWQVLTLVLGLALLGLGGWWVKGHGAGTTPAIQKRATTP